MSLPDDIVLDLSNLKGFEDEILTLYLIHSPIHQFETILISKKLQTTIEMWLLNDFKIQTAQKIVEKGEIAQNEQFHLFPQCFPKAFFFSVLKCVHMEERVSDKF